jgi:alpha-beta hydrolase superfamily lysophospholipase
VNISAISTIEEEQKKYAEDPLICHTACTAALGGALLQGIDELTEKAGKWNHPTLYFHGKLDTLVNIPAIHEMHDTQLHADKSIFVAENSRHEVFNDVDSEMAMTKVIEWILEHLK